MASIEYIEKRVAGKAKELEKLTKKMGRIQAAAATGWEKNPYYYDESDLRRTAREIEETRAALEKYQEDLQIAQQKANSRNVKAILEFLEGWKTRCMDFYGKGLRAAFDEKAEVQEIGRRASAFRYGTEEYKAAQAAYRERYKAYQEKLRGKYEKVTKERGSRKYTTEVKVQEGAWEYVAPLMRRSYEESMERLAKDLAEEANRKYDFIIERTNAIVGEITDAAGLEVGAKGDLNGYIKGTKGIAKVQTIGAGGYNIQCYHFRTLIHAA